VTDVRPGGPPLWLCGPALAVSCLLVGAMTHEGPWVAGLGLLVCLGLLAVLSRPELVAPAIALTVPLLSGLRRGLPVPGLKLSEVAIIIFAGAAVAASPKVLSRRWTAVDAAVIAYAATSLVFGIGHAMTDGGSNVQVFLTPTLLAVLYLAVAGTVDSELTVRRSIHALFAGSIITSVLAVLESRNLFGTTAALGRATGSSLSVISEASGSTRVSGPFPIWHSLGGYLLPIVFLAVALLLRHPRRITPVRSLVVVLLLGVAALVASLTIAVVIGLVIGVLVIGRANRHLGRVILIGLALGVALVLVFGTAVSTRYAQQSSGQTSSDGAFVPQTLTYRTEIWRGEYLPLLDQAAAFGIGTDLPASVDFRHTEMQYLTLVLRGGLTLLLVWIGMAVTVLWHVRRRALVDASETTVVLSVTLRAALLALLPMQFIWPYFTNAGFPQTFFVLLGLLIGSRSLDRARATTALRSYQRT
jgi:O-antigen ligase